MFREERREVLATPATRKETVAEARGVCLDRSQNQFTADNSLLFATLWLMVAMFLAGQLSSPVYPLPLSGLPRLGEGAAPT